MHRTIAALALASAAVAGSVAFAADTGRIGPSLKIVNNGRHLTPYGRLVNVGNVPTGGALTPDGRFYWTVSAGSGFNDIRIVSVKSAKVTADDPAAGRLRRRRDRPHRQARLRQRPGELDEPRDLAPEPARWPGRRHPRLRHQVQRQGQ